MAYKPYTFIASENTNDRFEIVYKLPRKDQNTSTEMNDVMVSITDNLMTVNADTDIVSILLYDITGKIVYEKTVTRMATIFNAPIYISKGVYISKITLSNTNTYTKKVIKQ